MRHNRPAVTESGPIERVLASRGWLVGVVVVGAALRVAHVLALRDTPFFAHLVVDPEYYDAWARRIAGGDWLGDRAFYMDPLYPYVLAVLYRAVGRDLLLARLMNVAFSTGACVLVARIGRQIGGAAVGGLAALGFALYAPDVFYTGEIDKTSFSMLLGAAALTLALSSSPRARFAAGAATAAAALTRANFLLYVPLGAAAYLVERSTPRARLTSTGVFLAGAALVLAPVAWRNHHVSGTWVLTTTQLGQNFYTGNNPTNPYGAYGAVPFVRPNPHFEEIDFRAAAERRTGRAMSPPEVSAFWLREGLAHIVAQPAFAARAFGRKLVLFWNDFEISDNQDQYLLERFSWALRLPLLGFGVMAPLAVLGMVAGWGRNRGVRLLAGFVAVYCGSLVAFFLFSRYRLPVMLALIPLAAVGVTDAVARVRARRGILSAAAVVGAAALVCHLRIGIFQRDHPLAVDMRLRHLAATQREVGQIDAAIASLEEAVAQCPPGCPWSLRDLFEVYRTTGRAAAGVRWFERFVRVHPEQRDAPEYLAELRAASSGSTGP
jgi:4-amino-4-deoxy-L-arabinose transferase-like glycosyltransferase